jgi:hypothetical protein
MARVVRTLALLALLAVVGTQAALSAARRGGPMVTPATTRPPVQNFGSYIVTCNMTDVTFYNFASMDCNGDYTFFSSPLNQCAPEYIPILNRNISWNAVCDFNNLHMMYNNYFDDQCATGSFLSRTYNLGGCYPCPNAECKDLDVPPPEVFGVLYAEQTPWLENQWHVEPGVVLVTSLNAGKVFRGTYNTSTDCVSAKTCNVSKETWISGFKAVSGITYDSKTRVAYALAVEDSAVEDNVLISFSPDTPSNHTVVAKFPAEYNLFGNLTLNGLARHESVESVFYVTNLGNFTPFMGSVLAVETKSGKVVTVMSNLSAADGAFIWRGMLYVSEVFSATVHIFDTHADPLHPTHLKSYVAPGLTSLDDFFVTGYEKEAFIVGADWSAGLVASWNANGTDNTSMIHAAGLLHPTSVRPEVDADGQWRTDFVTVTQGGVFPPLGRGANGGAIFRVRVRRMPPPIHVKGSLSTVNYTDATCASVNATVTTVALEECLHVDGTSTSEIVSCSILGGIRRKFKTPDCKGPSTDESLSVFKCEASGQISTFNFCAAL